MLFSCYLPPLTYGHTHAHTKYLHLNLHQSIEPFWHMYRQHYASDLPIRLMEHMVIGRLVEKDQVLIDAQMEALYETSEDPFDHEPVRHKALRVHSEHSMNAETP